jgi:serine phosphatase RsbU (regulator of sigma subunit)
MVTRDVPAASDDRLELLYRLSQTFSSSLDVDEVLNRVMDEVIAVLRAERGFVMLCEGDHLAFRAARGLDQQTIDQPQFEVSRGIVDQVAQHGRPVLTSNAQNDARFSMRESVVGLSLRSILCVPFEMKGRVLGVIYVDNRLLAGIFTEDDLELLTAIASSAAIALENARLYQVAVEKGRLERELQMARDVQIGLLPRGVPELRGWEFAARWQPARQVAGDFYDFIPYEDGRLGLVIADVADKGTPAALFMTLSRSILRGSVGPASSLRDGIVHANRLLCDDSVGGMFVTVFYGLLDPGSGELTYVNAGHNPPLLCRKTDGGGDEPKLLTRTGMALGVLRDAPFEEVTLRLDPGDCLLLYTDGVTDATGADQEPFGFERLLGVLAQHRGGSAASVMAALDRALGAFAVSDAPPDDVTVLVAKRSER